MKPNPFEEMNANYAEELAERSATAWESTRVRHLLTKFGANASTARLKAFEQGRTGTTDLTFHAVAEVFPHVPFVFRASTLRGIPVPYDSGRTDRDYAVDRDWRSTEPSRFKNFRHVPFVLEFLRQFESMSPNEERACGLVFPRRGFAHGLVVHDDDSETYWTSGLSWVYKLPELRSNFPRRPKLFVVPFTSLLVAIVNNKGRRDLLTP